MLAPSSALAQDFGIIRAPAELSARLDSLASDSPSLQAALDSIRSTPNARIFIHEQAIPDPDALAVTLHQDGVAVVVWDTRKIRRMSEGEVNALLIHEVFGHAVPFALHGEACRDPRDGERYLDSCVSERQEIVFKELGMRPRTRYASW